MTITCIEQNYTEKNKKEDSNNTDDFRLEAVNMERIVA